MEFSDSSSIKFWESVAILGGVAVIVGLFGELAEFLPTWLKSKRFRKWFHKKDRLLLDQLVRRFRLNLVPIEGWFFVLLMAGLAVELFGSAKAMLLSDAENRELRRELAAVDPRNANVSDLSATALLTVMGRTFNDLTNRDIKGRVAKMTLWNVDKKAAPFDILSAENFTPNEVWDLVGNDRIYGIRFHSFNFMSYMGQDTKVMAIDDLGSVRMEITFLATNSKIITGGVIVTVNNTNIQFQIDTNASGLEPGSQEFLVIATNVAQRPVK